MSELILKPKSMGLDRVNAESTAKNIGERQHDTVQKGRFFRPKRHLIADRAAKLLVVTCLCNLNGLILMLFGIGQVMSAVMLLTSVSIIFIHRAAFYRNKADSAVLRLLIYSIVAYMVLGTIYHDPNQSVHLPLKFYQAYIGAVSYTHLTLPTKA